ncbi:aldehyde dehydrogenase [Dissoconium aciculare CBS 342.82]|uniref:aldehyde dehydrogenase (NAD(+)) n=1 Tax=Dissoconium aciculare CBS 342.82 TaxID=1314786 RepID=A0A6J3M9D0_9PEZI|nr:aldehyde dehydrogenase [Dissoconium aciculare CBS 342.82]KAF1824625.1 aldehyde dehydrogenase [Dissoconium aciculare CBS 342.82]
MASQARYDTQPLYYNGQRQTTSETFQTINPATGESLGNVCKANQQSVHLAVQSAKEAFPKWSTTPPIERSRILLKAVALLRARNDDIARTETHDTGKAYSETSVVDVVTGADVLEYYANLIASGGLNGETTQLRPDAWVYTTKAPLGVCAGIGAWNYPIQIALWKSAPCLAAGNCMVYKPSEFTPLHALTLAEIYAEAGVPPGVFNVVQGAGDVGAMLTSHPDVAKVSFTGQVSTGGKVAGAAAAGMKYVTMELGGKSPCIILPDAPLENAVDGAMMANFYSTGQVCTNGTRVFVPRSMLSSFETRLLEKLRNIRSGDLFDPDTNFGPLVSRVHHEKVLKYIRHGITQDRARLIAGGPEPPVLPAGISSRGFWVQPTVFSDCTDNMKITTDEIFGPVLCILPYDDNSADWQTTLLRRANATKLGLAAGVFTRDLDAAHRFIAGLEAGITWINTWGESPAEMSVGGWKLSGLGVENGRRGLENWVQNKSTLVEMGGSVATAFVEPTTAKGPQSKL